MWLSLTPEALKIADLENAHITHPRPSEEYGFDCWFGSDDSYLDFFGYINTDQNIFEDYSSSEVPLSLALTIFASSKIGR